MPDQITTALDQIREANRSLDATNVPSLGTMPKIRRVVTGSDRLLATVDAVLSLADALATARRKRPRNLYEGGYQDAERQLGKVFREHIARALLGEDGT